MRLRSVIITMVGMGLAGASLYASQELLRIKPATASIDSQSPALVRVVVAAQEIPFGSVIDGSVLTTIQWPAEAVPPGVFSEYSALLPEDINKPRRAKRAMAQGELILQSKVSELGEKVTITQTLAPGNRAMAIRVNAQTSVGGFVTPGDVVDVVLTTTDGGGLKALTILQGIRIVGVDQEAGEFSESASIAKTVTVEVTPEQGQKLALAQRAGTLSLSLRSLENQADKPIQSIRLSDILSDGPVAAEDPRSTVMVRRGATALEEVEVKERDENGEVIN